MLTPREKFQGLLKKLFQFDRAELDFGIYRIMNQKRAAIERFIEHDLLDGAAKELASGALAQESGLAQQLAEVTVQIKENLGEEALDADGNLASQYHGSKRGRQYLELRERAGKAKSSPELEADIFNHLYAFFSRYYDEGDFMSLRRYSKRDKYAIPYNGEEVHLHWANADQYYIKTGENFTDYSYKHGGWTVHFKLRNADVEQNNVKGAKRFFLPRVADVALDSKAHTLTIPFEYRPLTSQKEITFKSKPQETILAEAGPKIVEAAKRNADALAALLHEKRKDADGDAVSLLDHHLRAYTQKNTSDFFIHKDLKGFLERELDFYLKNEVLNLDELEASGESRSAGWFQMLRAIKGIGRTIIAFVAQIENFQKRLFEKKKFVTEVHYCVTLDRVPEELYPEIAKNKAQIAEWKWLFHIQEIERDTTQPGYSEPPKVGFLKAHQGLVLDTRFFTSEFKDKLLASEDFLSKAESIDEALNGLLIWADNLNALRLVQARYRAAIGLTFIDAPYNTGTDGFIYKDSYQHSSWLTMMEAPLEVARGLFHPRALTFMTIDFVEVSRLRLLCDRIFGSQNFLADIAWEKRYTRSNNAKRFYSLKDTVLCYRASEELSEVKEGRSEKSKSHYTNPDKDTRGPWISSSYVNPATKAEREHLVYPIRNPFTDVDVEHPTHAWKYDPDTHRQHVAEKRLYWGENGSYEYPRLKTFLSKASEGMVPVDVWGYKETGTTDDGGKTLKALFGTEVFDNPKPVQLVVRALKLDQSEGLTSVVMDFFGGSGTTGHAVIELNREDEAQRKYLLVEVGDHFDTVLKPRLQKVIYSKDWKDGKPVSRQGSSHAFKYLRLESYEDALDNITFQVADDQTMLQLEDYVLSYMLDFETKESETLLNVAKLDAPFDYKLRRHGQDEPLPVDLPETFNYLIGLHVESRRVMENNGTRYLIYRGRSEGRETVILWRTTRGWTQKKFEADRDFVAELKLTEGAQDIFVNTDSFIKDAKSLDPVFKRRMFNGE